MMPVSLRFSSTCLLSLVASAGLSLAGDIIKLKSGEKLDGVILSETASEVKIEIQASKTVKETKTVQRKDIVELVKATPDQFAAVELAKLVPTKDLMSDAEYQKTIAEKLEPFLKKYPTSRHKGEVEAILKTYQEEMAQAKSGAKKLEGAWITPAELQWNNYNFEARLRRVELEKLLKAGKFEAAYRLLAELETNKPASVETVRALELFKAALPEMEKTLERLALEQPIKSKNRLDGAKTLSPEDQKRFEEALKQEEADLKLRLDEDRKAKLGITAYSEFDLKSLTDAKLAVAKEAARINKLDLDSVKAAATTFQTGLKNFHDKSYLAAQSNFESTAKVFPKDSFVKERTELAKKAAVEASRAAAEAGAAKPAAEDSEAKPGSPKSGKAGAPAKPAAASKAAAASAASEPAEAEAPIEEPASKLPTYLIAGAALLAVVLLGAKALTKKMGSAGDE